MPHSERVAVSQGKCGCGFGAWTSQAFPGPPTSSPPAGPPHRLIQLQWANSSAQPSSAFPGREQGRPRLPLCCVAGMGLGEGRQCQRKPWALGTDTR